MANEEDIVAGLPGTGGPGGRRRLATNLGVAAAAVLVLGLGVGGILSRTSEEEAAMAAPEAAGTGTMDHAACVAVLATRGRDVTIPGIPDRITTGMPQQDAEKVCPHHAVTIADAPGR